MKPNAVTQFISGSLDLFFPAVCPVCNRPLDTGASVCESCLDNLKPMPPGEWLDRVSVPDNLDSVWTAFWFDETLRTLIHLFKYKGYRRLGQRIAERVFFHLASEVPWNRFDCLVPIPLYHTKRRGRGYNQSAILARAIGSLADLRMDGGLVRRCRWTRTQTGLTVEQRKENMAEAFRVRRGGAGERILLVDDVLTTGATASACAGVLKAGGYGKVAVITVATPLKEH
jgi:ComF family protein